MREQITFSTPFGAMTATAEEGAVSSILLTDGKGGAASSFLREVKSEMLAYFRGEDCDFDFPVSPQGTPFERAVWEAARAIPYGELATYGDVARRIGWPKSYRAVGSALSKNPLLIVVPCHRIVPATGGIGCYREGSAMKRRLLEIERGDSL